MNSCYNQRLIACTSLLIHRVRRLSLSTNLLLCWQPLCSHQAVANEVYTNHLLINLRSQPQLCPLLRCRRARLLGANATGVSAGHRPAKKRQNHRSCPSGEWGDRLGRWPSATHASMRQRRRGQTAAVGGLHRFVVSAPRQECATWWPPMVDKMPVDRLTSLRR